ncbi:MAG TPA: hypothetical protein ENN65_02735 [Candidatus Hydrogenedentes bacterium]|nr:hypothetical protein [Candidatus Hydrogenedentota bacterium]
MSSETPTKKLVTPPPDSPDNDQHDALMETLHRCIHFAVKILAVMMTFVIFFGVLDVMLMFWDELLSPPHMIFKISGFMELFGAFLAVLIAIEIFVNITVYLREEVFHAKIVVGTALMAIARKIIILDASDYTPIFIFSMAALVVAVGIVYFLVSVGDKYNGHVWRRLLPGTATPKGDAS